MIQLDISSKGYELNDKILAYVNRKIATLDKFLPAGSKNGRGSVMLQVDGSGREGNQCVCEAILKVPGVTLQSKEATLNMYAAVDIVEAKLRAQAVKYKQKVKPQSRRQALIAKLLNRQAAESGATD